MSPSRVLLRWVDRFGVRPANPHEVVAFVRVFKSGWFRWEYEIWWTMFRPRLTRHTSVEHIPVAFAGRGRAPTRFQCVALSGRFVATHSRKD